MIKTITATELKARLEHNEVTLIDVREPVEHQVESIRKSHLIPLGELCCEKLPTKKMPIVTHCRSGKRSAEGCQKLLKEDPSLEVYSLEGGITAWKDAGYPVETFAS